MLEARGNGADAMSAEPGRRNRTDGARSLPHPLQSARPRTFPPPKGTPSTKALGLFKVTIFKEPGGCTLVERTRASGINKVNGPIVLTC